MALGRMNLPIGSVPDYLDFPRFHAIEVPAEFFAGTLTQTAGKLASRFPIVHCGGLLEQQLTANVPLCSLQIQEEFILQCGRMIEALSVNHVHTATLEFDMNSVLCNPDSTAAVMRIVRRLSGSLLKHDMVLLLPFRLPSMTDANPELMMSFLRNTMAPNLKVRLDLYPHALPKDFTPEHTAGLLGFETRSMVFVYDADSGNRLVPEHVIPWVNHLAKLGIHGPFLSCPNSYHHRMVFPEAESFSEFVSDLRNR